ncbi:MAG: hypothetical protein HKN09_10210 [Saprospiraceae bacterium]|nr:hypothetical protein [Saprospiraceae bacterium]
MKRVLLIAVIMMSFMTLSWATIIPSDASILINTAEVEVSLENNVQKDVFKHSAFNAETNSFDFVTYEEIEKVQIYGKNGVLQFQLPVHANKVRIDLKLFDKGDNKLGFIIQGHDMIEYTGVKVK